MLMTKKPVRLMGMVFQIDLHFFFCRSTSVCFAGQNSWKGDSLGYVIVQERYGGAD
jgi:hypothetical protein